MDIEKILARLQKPIKKKILSELFIQLNNIEKYEGIEREQQILRLGIIAELDAVSLYEQMAELSENEDVKKVLLDIAKEEKVHVGEFETLLKDLDKEFEDSLNDGENEVEDLV